MDSLTLYLVERKLKGRRGKGRKLDKGDHFPLFSWEEKWVRKERIMQNNLWKPLIFFLPYIRQKIEGKRGKLATFH